MNEACHIGADCMSENTHDTTTTAATDAEMCETQGNTMDAVQIIPQPAVNEPMPLHKIRDVFCRKWAGILMLSMLSFLLPRKVFKQIDPQSILLVSTNFFAGPKEKICDILYQFQFITDRGSGLLHYLLVEFSTYFTNETAWRFHLYYNLILQRFGDEYYKTQIRDGGGALPPLVAQRVPR
jgi:hypothetical protein